MIFWPEIPLFLHWLQGKINQVSIEKLLRYSDRLGMRARLKVLPALRAVAVAGKLEITGRFFETMIGNPPAALRSRKTVNTANRAIDHHCGVMIPPSA